ncbi:MAG: LTA synthase family protein [Candidatus Electrothrix sp. MAN1_4]|nr:LTA synthase family protein [Candidatus Electrothrix sp. MAN1_4]
MSIKSLGFCWVNKKVITFSSMHAEIFKKDLPSFLFIIIIWGKLVYWSNFLACCGSFPEHRAIWTASLASLLLFVTPFFSLSRIKCFFSLLVVNLILTILFIGDEIHFRFYGDIISITEISAVWMLPFVSSSIVAVMKLSDILSFVDIIIGIAFFPLLVKWEKCGKLTFNKKRQIRLFLLISGVLLSIPGVLIGLKDPEGVFECAVGRRHIVGAVGIFPYHLYDGVKYLLYPVLGKMRTGEEERQQVRSFIKERDERFSDSLDPPWFAKARGKNLILIQAESLHLFPIGLDVNGQSIAPNLDRLASESMFFSNFHDQTYAAATSDSVFSALQSLYPLAEGAVANRFATNHFNALPTILKRIGYSTISGVGSSGQWWNMRLMHPQLGFQKNLFRKDYASQEVFGQGLADGPFFEENLTVLSQQAQPFMAFFISSSNHHPFNIPQKYRKLQLGSLENTLVGNYLHSVHYFDWSIGEFIKGLRQLDLLEKSVFAVFGDHQAWLGKPPELYDILDVPSKSEYHQVVIEKKLPLMIRLPYANNAGILNVSCGHLDIAPTLLGLLGVRNKKDFMMGRVLTRSEDSLVVFRDGSFTDGNIYYINRLGAISNSSCYMANTGQKIDCGSYEEKRLFAQKQLEISDIIIRGDLLPEFNSN